MLLFGVIRRKQQIILSYIQNSKWNSALDGLAGQGISLQPEGEIGKDLAQGCLLELLPGFRVAPMEIHAITPQREIPEKVRRVVEALRSYFGTL